MKILGFKTITGVLCRKCDKYAGIDLRLYLGILLLLISLLLHCAAAQAGRHTCRPGIEGTLDLVAQQIEGMNGLNTSRK